MNTTVKRRRQAVSTGTERICAHNIEWRLDGRGLKLSDTDIEHITNCLIDNYVQGELCTLTPRDQEICGWWNIEL
jgi:hypothetical protein